jgi:hypothetical protein
MEILCHRGFWKTPDEKNTEVAFRRAFQNGDGVETDIRDYNGQLVVSHDIPTANSMKLNDFLQPYRSYPQGGTLAINIKSDGLQVLLKESLKKFSIDRYFVFDMNIPDTLGYLKSDLQVFARVSEFESVNSQILESCQGLWVDIFLSDWVDKKIAEDFLKQKKKVALVSPELHKRNSYFEYWGRFNEVKDSNNFMLCTDMPEEAKKFFGIKI